ncbi:MAG TPA: nucleoside transporter C-terminal domain-containing protein [Longimicrobiales bacterium]|nr:nucleoside transporter C-terminal domain-containing protein [Longimicrobiales bacterium]
MKRPGTALVVLWTAAVVLVSAGAWTSLGAEAPAAAVAAQAQPQAQAGPRLSVPQGALGTPLLERLRSVLGLLALTGIAWLMSVDRARVAWRVVAWGISLQLVFALFILKTPVGVSIFETMNVVIVALLGFTVDGARFLFGNLVYNTVPVGAGDPGQGAFTEMPGMVANTGGFFAFNVLPTIIFFSSLMTILYHLGIMQLAVKGVAWVMQSTMKTSGAETLSAAGNIFVGQTEAPLLIKPFVERMTMSELMAVMTAGFATVAGGVMAAYVGMLLLYFPDIAGHLMAASVMSAPAALVVAKLMVPETETAETAGRLDFSVERPDVNVIDAAARGASEGLYLALNVGALLLAFVALIYMCNGMLGWVGGLAGLEGLTLEAILGWVLAPLAWLMGVPWADAPQIASLMGVKTVLNEFFAYIQLAGVLGGEHDLQPRSIIIVTYALAGFANFSSIAIQLGGIGGIAPSRRHDLSRLGLRAMIGGSIAAFMTATVAGMIL